MKELIGVGAVLPPGTLPTVSLQSNEVHVRITGVSDEDGMLMARVEYPDEFVKNHQADNGVHDLLGKITNQLRGRYGVSTFSILSLPPQVSAGEIYVFGEVQYDA